MFEKARKRVEQLRNLAAANYRIDALEKQIGNLSDELDAFRSSFEVSPQLIQEFLDWKAMTPIPDHPLVSVCVATYNRARSLTERCIQSVLQQSYSRFELIVVGDGCTDDTEKRIAEISDPRLTFLNLPERGEYPEDPTRRWMVAGTPAVNKAMALAQGDYITHLDDDDEYLPGRLEKLVAFSTLHNCDLVWHPFWLEEADGGWRLIEARDFAKGSVTTSSVFYRHWLKNIQWQIESHRLLEPGDWNRFRRIKYLGPVVARYPESLVRQYKERSR